MKNHNIGSVLKEYRKHNALSIPDVCLILREQYDITAAPKTIYGWESNQSRPTADTFLILCEIYRIENLSVFNPNHASNDFPITADERRMILAYRKTPQMQPAIRRLLHLDH